MGAKGKNSSRLRRFDLVGEYWVSTTQRTRGQPR
jgi:hypothetical protein